MTMVLTGKYDTAERARNAFNDLINAGFDREKVFFDRETAHLKVMTPNDAQREARDILDRHGPLEVFQREA